MEPDPIKLRLFHELEIDLVRRYEREGDVLNWGAILFPSRFTLPFCQEMHGYFVQIQDEEFTSTQAPRGRSKTTIKCFLIPLFKALTQPSKYRHYLNVQATEDKALAVNRSIKTELENNELLREVYGDQIGDRWTDGQFVLRSGVVFTAIGAGQSIRGINFNNYRPDCILVDDLYDQTDIESPESTLKKNSWFWSDLYPARAQDHFASIHVQGTAINKYDLLEELEKLPSVKSRTFRSVIDWDKHLVLWPELKDWDAVMAEKEKMPEVIWYREYQNERRDDATSIVKRAWLTNWEFDPIDLERQIRAGRTLRLVEVLIGNDPSIGKKLENDFTGTALIYKTQWIDAQADQGNDYWIMGLWNEKLSLQARKDQLFQINVSQPPDRKVNRVLIEAIAGFIDYADEVKRTTNLPVQSIEQVKDKISVLVNKSHYFQNGKVHLNKNIEPKLKTMIVDQLTINHPLHDDVRDGVLLCIEPGTGLWNFVY